MLTVNVVMGGPSAEHEISLLTGREVLRHLDKSKYLPKAVVITHQREIFIADTKSQIPEIDALENPTGSNIFNGPYALASSEPIWKECDIAFLGLHGSFGEDGTFQGYLESMNIPYTGSDVFASAVSMNKIASKMLFEAHNIITPPSSVFGKSHPDATVESIAEERGFPCFVKCPQSGSSRLMGKANKLEELESLLREFSGEADDILIETAIQGIELSCAALEQPDGKVQALPPVEIRPKQSSFFDFTAKYTDDACEEIVPAPQPQSLLNQVKDTAILAHRILGCSCVSRTDMIANEQGLYVLELNSLPGLTPNSLVPKAFASEGGTYTELLDLIIQRALNKRKK